jgi:hypothetical protein
MNISTTARPALVTALAVVSLLISVPPAGAAYSKVPGRPTHVEAKAGNAIAIVSWVAPSKIGNSAITSYQVSSVNVTSPSAPVQQCSTPAPGACVVTGLTNSDTYKFNVRAFNSSGASAYSAYSAQVTPQVPPAPPLYAPSAVTASALNGTIQVSWSPAPVSGTTLTGYTATASPGPAKCSTTSELTCTLTGLTANTPYTVTVAARSAGGYGPSSPPSLPVTLTTVASQFRVTIAPFAKNSWSLTTTMRDQVRSAALHIVDAGLGSVTATGYAATSDSGPTAAKVALARAKEVAGVLRADLKIFGGGVTVTFVSGGITKHTSAADRRVTLSAS